jgi:hypothetical protein
MLKRINKYISIEDEEESEILEDKSIEIENHIEEDIILNNKRQREDKQEDIQEYK